MESGEPRDLGAKGGRENATHTSLLGEPLSAHPPSIKPQRKAGWKAPAKTPGRQGKRPASDEDRLPDEPPRAQGFPVHKIEKSPRPAIFN